MKALRGLIVEFKCQIYIDNFRVSSIDLRLLCEEYIKYMVYPIGILCATEYLQLTKFKGANAFCLFGLSGCLVVSLFVLLVVVGQAKAELC